MWSKFYGFMWGVNITKKAQKGPVALQSRQSMKRLTIKRGEKKETRQTADTAHSCSFPFSIVC